MAVILLDKHIRFQRLVSVRRRNVSRPGQAPTRSNPNVNVQHVQASRSPTSSNSQNRDPQANMNMPARTRSRSHTIGSQSQLEYGQTSTSPKHQVQGRLEIEGRHHEGRGPRDSRERSEEGYSSASPGPGSVDGPPLASHPLGPRSERDKGERESGAFGRDRRDAGPSSAGSSSSHIPRGSHYQMAPISPSSHPSIAHLPTRNQNQQPLTGSPHTTSTMSPPQASVSTLRNLNTLGTLNTLSFSYPSHPPAKRRRAKRTEEERIAYLRSDPYVAQFEAYRVLCASCDKWIRLRPNSTYCSIPWDAHRKSCLAKKIMNRGSGTGAAGGYALEERNAFLSKDPDVRKFDAERVLCAVCDAWIDLHPEDHLAAVKTWLDHRAGCRKDPTIKSMGLALIGIEEAHGPPSEMMPPASTMHREMGREESRGRREERHMNVDEYRHRSESPAHHRQRHPAQHPGYPHPHSQDVHRIRERERDIRPISPPVSHRPTHHSENEKREYRSRDQERHPQQGQETPHLLHSIPSSPPAGRETRLQRRMSLQHPQQPPHPQRERSVVSASAVSVTADNDMDADASVEDDPEEEGSSTKPTTAGPSRASSLHTVSSSGQLSRADSRGPYPTDSQLEFAEREHHRQSQAQQQQVFNAAAGQFPPGPAHESRRRNAEQRAATLRADKLIKEVEANRVFCSLCMKWVQLRQDSSYCAYPWLQHRGKCLARHQRRAQKAAEIADIKARRSIGRVQTQPSSSSYPQNAYPSASGTSHPSLHSRSSRGHPDVNVRSHVRRDDGPYIQGPYSPTGLEHGRPPLSRAHSSASYGRRPPHGMSEFESDVDMEGDEHARRFASPEEYDDEYEHRRQQPMGLARRPTRHSGPTSVKHEDLDYDDVDAEGDMDFQREDVIMDEESDSRRHEINHSRRYMPSPNMYPRHHPYDHARTNGRHHPSSSRSDAPAMTMSRSHAGPSSPVRRSGPTRSRPVLADLDSPVGRKHFVYSSIAYLFTTTYEATDDMSISTLLTYLNSAMPPDKYEDFDTSEVVRAVSSLKEKGKILFEGDLVKRVPGFD
ncbi:hypothetical protein VKT23_011649 [Stygiomarasmius scandens]|uniref:Uncharacterized protein n=1 Tax=Marasmiellus scandens TaxID=2682957 RepID=A0ABR1J7N9_9AGAR